MKTTLELSLLSGLCLALAGCPGPAVDPDTGRADAPTTDVPTPDAGTPIDGGGSDTGIAVDTGGTDAPGTDAPIATPDGGGESDAPIGMDSGVVSTWTECREAVVFGVEGEACSFTGSCVECLLVASPRQVLCMGGRLRTAAAGAGACTSTTDAGVFTFPDSGPRPDVGVGVDGGGFCPPFVIPTPEGAVCSPDTVDCIREGGDPGTCITADPVCLSCAQSELAACATANGCDDEAGAARCCFEANCPDASCAGTTCATSWNAYVACADSAPCSVTDLCFPSAPACPPAAWPTPAAPGCTAATLACIEAAPTGAAFQACLDADTASTPAGASCNECINDDLLSCATNLGGCEDELGLVQCCFEAECPAGDAACINASVAAGGACAGEWDGFFECANDSIATGPCGYSEVCFP